MSSFTDTTICWMCQSSPVSSILLSLLNVSVMLSFIDTTVCWTCQSSRISLTLLSTECVSHVEIHWHYYWLNVSRKSSFTDTTVCWRCQSCPYCWLYACQSCGAYLTLNLLHVCQLSRDFPLIIQQFKYY